MGRAPTGRVATDGWAGERGFLPVWTWDELAAELQAITGSPARRREIETELAILRQEAEGRSAGQVLRSILALGYLVADDQQPPRAESAIP